MESHISIIEGEGKKERKSYRKDRKSDIYIVDRREREREREDGRKTDRGKGNERECICAFLEMNYGSVIATGAIKKRAGMRSSSTAVVQQ